MNLNRIIETLIDYKIIPECDHVRGGIDRHSKVIYAQTPYQTETIIHELYHAMYPKMHEDKVHKKSQRFLHNHEEVKRYLVQYLKSPR